jgi:hypothetical protein
MNFYYFSQLEAYFCFCVCVSGNALVADSSVKSNYVLCPFTHSLSNNWSHKWYLVIYDDARSEPCEEVYISPQTKGGFRAGVFNCYLLLENQGLWEIARKRGDLLAQGLWASPLGKAFPKAFGRDISRALTPAWCSGRRKDRTDQKNYR